MKTAALVLLWASAAAAQPGAGNEEAHNVRLVDFHDLAVRSAYQPTIKKQGDHWIAYKGIRKSIREQRQSRYSSIQRPLSPATTEAERPAAPGPTSALSASRMSQLRQRHQPLGCGLRARLVHAA